MGLRASRKLLSSASCLLLLVLGASGQIQISGESPPLQSVILAAPESGSVGINARTETLQYAATMITKCATLCYTRVTAVTVPANETTLALLVGLQTGNETFRQVPEQLSSLNATAQGGTWSPLAPASGLWPGWIFFSTGLTFTTPGVQASVKINANALPAEFNTPTLPSNTIEATSDNKGPKAEFK